MLSFSFFAIFVCSLSASTVGALSVPEVPDLADTIQDPLIVCKENEIISPCYNNYCVRRFCEEEAPSQDCKLEEPCVQGCMCKEGYLRAENETCVPESVCTNPIKCGENEMFSHCVNGGCSQTNCSELGRPALCRDLIAGYCKSGCTCKDDYLRTKNGICVPKNDCPKEEVCTKPHEYYDLCPSLCPGQYCSSYDSTTPCPPQPQLGDPGCYPSCQCEEGYFRNAYQDCVPFEDCGKYCSGYGETLVAYPESCDQETCDSINNEARPIQNSNKTCNSECRCVGPNYVRNKRGNCVMKEDCNKCVGPNEYLDCGLPCDNVCATLDEMDKTNCPIKLHFQLCVQMCYCEDGYARDANNECIPIAECPNKKQSKE